MASPISAGEVYAVAKFAYDLFRSCQKAKGQFDQVANEVSAMRAILQMAHLECKNPMSILNKTDTKDRANRKALGIHLRRCNQALEDTEACLKRFNKMSAIDKIAWSWSGRDEIKGLESNLSSFATQLDSFIGQLALKGVGAVYEGIGRIEEALERLGGNDGAAVKDVMQGLDQSNMTPQCTEQYKSIISDYAKEVSSSTNFGSMAPKRAQTPDPRGRNISNGSLGVPTTPNEYRSKSADTPRGAKNLEVKKDPGLSTMIAARKKPRQTLECWLIQIKSGHLSLVTWEFSEKLVQTRGQWKLEQMAQQFKASKKSKLGYDHDLVSWVLKDRRKAEDNPLYTWYPYAAKKEEKGSLMLNLGVEEQAMVIIRRALTAEAQRKEKEKERAVQAKKAAARKKATKEAADRKAKYAAAEKVKSEKEKQKKALQAVAKKKENIKNLEEENAKLKQSMKKAEMELKAKADAVNPKQQIKEQIRRLEEENARLKAEKRKAEKELNIKEDESKKDHEKIADSAKDDAAKEAGSAG